MAVDSKGTIYVTDERDGCIQKFSISGNFIGQFGSPGVENGELCGPVTIAIDDKDYVHISEPALQRVSVFTSTGSFIRCFQVCSSDNDSDVEDEDTPKLTALAFDKQENLYVCMPAKGQVVTL